jgi:hypothetical protein
MNMKKIMIIFLVLFLSQCALAQSFSRKFGKVTKDELEMKTYDKAPDAEAVVLYEDIDVRYEFSGAGIQLVYSREIKIKILKKEGTSWGDGEFILYNRGKGGTEFLSGHKGTAYNLVDGKIVESELKKEYIFKEKLDDVRTRVKFSIPEVREGSVVEYKYKISSDYILTMPDIDIQHSIPVMYSTFKVDAPEYFEFKPTVKGYHRLNIQRHGGNGSSGGLQYLTNIVTCETEHVPALKDDSYVWCLDDFTTKVEFELSAIKIPMQIPRFYNRDWKSVNETLEKSDFNSNLKTSYPFKKEVADIKASDISDKDKIRSILKLVQSKMKWNKTYSIQSNSPRSAAEKGTGSSGDINFVLHSALRDAGFDVVPILLNPRIFGRLPLANAAISKLHTFIIRITLNGEFLYVDGTNPHSDINVLPTNLLVDRARIYKVNDQNGWVDLTNISKNATNTLLVGNIDESGVLEGTISKKYINQNAYMFANRYDDYKTKEEYVEYLTKHYNGTIEDVEIEGLGTLEINEKIKFSTTLNTTAEYIYLNALVFPYMSENPLKQQERILPVEFSFPEIQNITCIINIPENFKVEERPENVSLSACEDGVKYSYISQNVMTNLQVKFNFTMNRIIYPTSDYKDLSAFYGMLVQRGESQIVIKKN